MLLNSGVFCVRLVAIISTWLRRLMNDGFINRSEIRYRASFAQKQCFRLMKYGKTEKLNCFSETYNFEKMHEKMKFQAFGKVTVGKNSQGKNDEANDDRRSMQRVPDLTTPGHCIRSNKAGGVAGERM